MRDVQSLLTTFWIEEPGRFGRRFGISAYSRADALDLFREVGYEIEPEKVTIREGIRVADLDADHVIPNMGVMARRGVWYPDFNSSRWE